MKVVLAEINEEFDTDYQMKDVYIVFDREVMTNAQDNAEIEKIDAEKQQIQINTLMVAANALDDETVLKRRFIILIPELSNMVLLLFPKSKILKK